MLAGAALGLGVSPALSEEPLPGPRPQQNLFGMTGLIDMPSAEMQPDGQLSFTSSYFGGYLRNTLSAQIFSGIEGAFRYSVLEDFSVPGQDTLYDRSFDVKVRLVQESELWPGVAVGLQDFLGTGIYSGEYIVGTKRFFNGAVALTGGVGWGRFATGNGISNIFCDAIDSFCSRDQFDGTGGEVNFGRFFQGEEMGLFAGLQWDTPIEGLTFKAEYSNDDYVIDNRNGNFDLNIPINLGLEYRPMDGVDIGAYYMYGDTFGIRVSLSTNPFTPAALSDDVLGAKPFTTRPVPARAARDAGLGEVRELLTGTMPATSFTEAGLAQVAVEPREDGLRWAVADLPPSADDICPAETAAAVDAELGYLHAITYRSAGGEALCTVALRPAGASAVRQAERGAVSHPTDWYANEDRRRALAERLANELGEDRIGLIGIQIAPTRTTVYIENRRFLSMPRAVGRTARALARIMPPSVEQFEIVPVEASLPTVSIVLERGALEDYVNRPDGARDMWLSASVDDAAPVSWSELMRVDETFPRFSWLISPTTPISLFDPDQPVRADLSLLTSGTVEVWPGISTTAAVQGRIIGNLDDIERDSDSVLPRVRSDVAEYQQADIAIERWTADYVTKLDGDIYARLSGGLLERMFGGVSAELLWKPANQSWGLGAEVNWTQQRDFEGFFGFQDYDVVTAHASLYWDTGFHGISAQLDAGRYLAGDYGGTFTLSRRFPNGWELGAFFTLTDVPFDEFGEGSFDRGIILTIPFNFMLPQEGRAEYRTVIRPLTRDGGQRLNIANRLYPALRDNDRGGLRTRWGNFWE